MHISLEKWCRDNQSHILEDWDYELNDYTPDRVQQNSHTPFHWKCHKCGKLWMRAPFVAIRSILSGCTTCKRAYVSHERHMPKENEDLATLYADSLMKEWDWTQNNAIGLKPNEVKPGSNKKAHWICLKCNNHYKAVIKSRAIRGTGCRKCGLLSSGKSRSIPKPGEDCPANHPEIMEDWDWEKNKVDPHKIKMGSNQPIHWICSFCKYRWCASLYSRTQKSSPTGCPQCNGSFKKSKREFMIGYYLKKSGLSIEHSYTKQFLGNSEIDIFIPELNIGIEYDGVVYHKRKYDADCYKTDLCSKNQIELIHIREDNLPDIPNCVNFHSIGKNEISMNETIQALLKYLGTKTNLLPVDVNIEKDRVQIMSEKRNFVVKNSIASDKESFLYKEWDWKKNNPLRPEFFTRGSHDIVWWKCPECGESYQKQIKVRSRQTYGCVYCHGKKGSKTCNILLDPILSLDWDWDKNTLNPEHYRQNSTKKFYWTCHKCEESDYSQACQRKKGGCPYCGTHPKKPTKGKNDLETFARNNNLQFILDEWSPDNEKSPSDYLPQSHEKVKWICPVYGISHTYNRKICIQIRMACSNRCVYCSNRQVLENLVLPS